MATKRARAIRQENRKNGFLVVETASRLYSRKYGCVKVGVPDKLNSIPDSERSPSTHVCTVRQKDETLVRFKVQLGATGLVTISRKNGTGLKPYRRYEWTGRSLRPITVERTFSGILLPSLTSKDLFLDRPILTHEQCCDIERALVCL